jgi:hypothetical protein
MGRPSGLLSFAPHDSSCGACAGWISLQNADHGVAAFFIVQCSAAQIEFEFCAQTQNYNVVTDKFLAGGFNHHRTACTDFDALSQNLAVKVSRKF